jgi:glycine oxidase
VQQVVVVGGGVIGLAAAWRAKQRGLDVLVLDAGEEAAAWRWSAGMLAPVTEAEHGEEALLALGLRSAALYPAFAAELAADAGQDPGFRPTGTLVVARDRDEAEELERLHALHRAHGLASERLRPTQARRLEPGLAPSVRLALDVPGDLSIDPRRLVAALWAAVGGVRRARVERLAMRGDRVAGVALAGGEVLDAERVLVAAGAWSHGIDPGVPVRPVKGQVLRLRDPAGPGLVERTIRTRDAYFVPRDDGSYLLGATVEERGWSTTPTAGGVFELVRDLSEVVPGVLELEIEAVGAGLRPGSPDNLPSIGPGAVEGLVWATGHYRNGILLTPVTAELAAAALAGESLPEWASACDPSRFARTEVLA